MVHLKKKFKIIISIIFGIFSFIVLYEETTIFLEGHFSLIGLLIKHPDREYLSCLFFTSISLGYILFCVFYGFFRLKVLSKYGIYEDHNTDSSSLLFTSVNFSRVSAPLCCNFLNIIGYKKCAFNYVLGDINLVPLLGPSLSIFFPFILVLFTIFHLFDL